MEGGKKVSVLLEIFSLFLPALPFPHSIEAKDHQAPGRALRASQGCRGARAPAGYRCAPWLPVRAAPCDGEQRVKALQSSSLSQV